MRGTTKTSKLIAMLIEERAVTSYLSDYLNFDRPPASDLGEKHWGIARRSVEAELNRLEKHAR